MKKYLFIILTISFIVSGCFKKDEILPFPEPGNVLTDIIPLTNFYSNQVYYDLETNEITGINERSTFDMIFECLDTSTIIRLNTADFAMAAITDYEEFEAIDDTSGFSWKFDGSTGSLDSLALNGWISIDGNDTSYSNKVFVVNRGINSVGVSLGLRKVKFDSLVGMKFYFTYCNFDNSEVTHAVVTKSKDHLYTQFSFDNKQLQTEPVKDEWDLLFTQYSTMLFTNEGVPYPYLVTGVVQQYGIVQVALDTAMEFSQISISDTATLEFSLELDKIGYDWKQLIGDVNSGNVSYEVKPNFNYIIKDGNSYFYKLRFVNFYNPETGEKGFPVFEYQRL